MWCTVVTVCLTWGFCEAMITHIKKDHNMILRIMFRVPNIGSTNSLSLAGRAYDTISLSQTLISTYAIVSQPFAVAISRKR